MAIKVSYVGREVGQNLWRNITLTVATVATVAVSLGLVGIANLARYGIDNATQRFSGGVEFIIFIQPNASQANIDAIEAELEANPGVDEFTFFTQEDAYEEFEELFADDEAFLETVEPEILPPSFRVKPVDTDAEAVQVLGEVFEGKPGVREVVFNSEVVKRFERFFDVIRNGILWVAIALLAAAVLLIFNTIHMGIIARRREIEVQKLVGATNWFIRVPFMVEGLIQGLIGAAFSLIVVRLVANFFDEQSTGDEAIPILSDFVVSAGEVTTTSVILIILGSAVGLVGSGLAVSRFLRV